MAEVKDWFKIYRSLLSDPMWLSEPFTKGQAWVDLIGRANYGTTEHISGPHCIYVYRGQLPTSILALSRRWNWSRAKVDNFLSALVEAKMITLKKTSNGTTITIENYGIYQNNNATELATKRQQNDNKKATDFAHKKNNQEYTKNTQECACDTSYLEDLAKTLGIELTDAGGNENDNGTD